MEKQYNFKVFRNFSGKIIYKKDNSYFWQLWRDCVTGIVGNVDWMARFRTFFQFSYSGKLPVRRRISEKSTHELHITFHRLRSVFLFNYKPLTSASFNNIADKMARTNKHALRKVTGVYTERTVTLLLKLSVISSVR